MLLSLNPVLGEGEGARHPFLLSGLLGSGGPIPRRCSKVPLPAIEKLMSFLTRVNRQNKNKSDKNEPKCDQGQWIPDIETSTFCMKCFFFIPPDFVRYGHVFGIGCLKTLLRLYVWSSLPAILHLQVVWTRGARFHYRITDMSLVFHYRR